MSVLEHCIAELQKTLKRVFVDMEHIVETCGGGTIVAKDVYMCGPSEMTESFQPSLRKLGVSPIHIHFEHFTRVSGQ